jgi:hypothetical protein
MKPLLAVCALALVVGAYAIGYRRGVEFESHKYPATATVGFWLDGRNWNAAYVELECGIPHGCVEKKKFVNGVEQTIEPKFQMLYDGVSLGGVLKGDKQ